MYVFCMGEGSSDMVGSLNLGTTKGVSRESDAHGGNLALALHRFLSGPCAMGIACHCMSWLRAGSNQGSSHPESLFFVLNIVGFRGEVGGRVSLKR
jgi:hypothetical protein